jgi:hypothetical protein
MKMENEALRRLIGGVYFAICDVLGDAAAARANESLYAFASENADSPACANLCVALADCEAETLPGYSKNFDFRSHLKLVKGS